MLMRFDEKEHGPRRTRLGRRLLLWSCRESNPLLYPGFCLLTLRFVTSRCRSVPLYLRVRSRVLTASRALAYRINLLSHIKRERAALADIASA